MINNARLAVVVGLAMGAAACASSDPEASALQGVIEYEERDLGFETTGRIAELAVIEGDILGAGALIARIAPDLERSALSVRQSEVRAAEQQVSLLRVGARPEEIRALRARIDAARAGEQLLKINADRARKLFAAEATTRAVLDDAEAQLARAEAERRALEETLQATMRGARRQEIQAAQDRLEGARGSSDVQRERVARFELRALDPAQVLEVHLRRGEIATVGAPVVTVADTARPYADLFVAQGDLAGIHAGAPAHARVDALAHELHGRVERVSRRTEFTPRYLFSRTERANLVVRVRVRFDDPGAELHAGVPIFARIDRTAAATPAPAPAPPRDGASR